MSKSQPVFEKLSILADFVKKTEQLDKRFDDAIARERNIKFEYRNIPQYPARSSSTVKALSSEYQDLVNDSHRLYHSLNTASKRNGEMIQNAEKVLQWMESGVEQFMKSHGLTTLGISATGSENSQLTGETCSAESPSPLKSNVKTTVDPVVNEDISQHKANYESSSSTLIFTNNKDAGDAPAPLKSPVLPPILKHYRSKSDSFCSPQDPLKGQFFESNEDNQKTTNHLFRNPMNLESPQLRAFSRPTLLSEVESPSFSGRYFSKNVTGKGDIFSKGQSTFFFNPMQSPQCNAEVTNSPDLTLHSRRSILAQPPAPVSADDDDTVYRLFSHGRHQTMQHTPESPPPPNLAFHKNIPATRYDKASPYLLPSPEMPADVLPDRNAYLPLKSQDYEICQSKYDTLPSYVKRIMGLPKCNECLKNVIDASVAWQGNERKEVTTETTVAEVTALGGKTKSFIFILKTLGIIKEIKGTSYYEILV